MTRYILASITALTIAATAAQAQSFNVRNTETVTPVSAATFAINTGGTFGAQGTWCAAANYAYKNLNAGDGTRIYVLEGHSRPSGRVLFSTSQGNTTPTSTASLAASLRTPGYSQSAGQAFAFCDVLRLKSRR